MFGAGTLRGSVAEEIWIGNKTRKSLGSEATRTPGLSRLVSQFEYPQGTTSSKMLSVVAGKTIETLIKQLVPNDKGHYLKSVWIENGKHTPMINCI